MISRGLYRHCKGGLYWVETVAVDGAFDSDALAALQDFGVPPTTTIGAVVVYWPLANLGYYPCYCAVRDFTAEVLVDGSTRVPLFARVES
jgi:hypothetical protein